MRRTLILAFVVTGLAGCGGSSATKPVAIEFGTIGGSIRPFSVSIRSTGVVHQQGLAPPVLRRTVTEATVVRLDREIEGAHLASTNCTNTLPDVASRYIRVGGRTVTVHGNCEAPFGRIWDRLAAAVGGR